MEEASIGAVWHEAWPYWNVTTQGMAPNAIQFVSIMGFKGGIWGLIEITTDGMS
jgi:hypothetical protein